MFGFAVAVIVAIASGLPGAITTGRTNLTAADVQIATANAEPQLRKVYWRCDQHMTIRPAAGEGVTTSDIRKQLAYPVATLRALGYDVTIGKPADYITNMGTWTAQGEVIVTVTRDATDQKYLGNASARALLHQNGPEIVGGTVIIDDGAHNEALAGDILLHELGHLLGLGHHDGSVMSEGWNAPATFDASDVATVDCR